MTYPRDCQRPQDHRSYELYWCDACSFGQLQPRPSQAEADGFYENYYTHIPWEAGARPRRAVFERVRERIAWSFDRGSDMDVGFIHRLVEGRPSRICDLGCGEGRLIAALRDRGHRVVGVEPDPVTLQLAAKRGLEVHRGHADNPPAALERGTFDVVVMCHVRQLCLDPARAIASARALLRPGGLLVCETTNNEAEGLRQLGACWRWLDMPRHVDLVTARSLRRVVAGAGLTVRRLDFTGYTRQFKRDWLEDEARKRAFLYPSQRRGRAWQALQAWLLLARTLLARPERKYDSVRVVGEANA
jgi:SAM-dependent methyltransferase